MYKESLFGAQVRGADVDGTKTDTNAGAVVVVAFPKPFCGTVEVADEDGPVLGEDGGKVEDVVGGFESN
jgi:hypothetical protein